MTMNTHCCTASVLLVLFVVFSVFADERYRSVDRERRLEQSDVRDLDRDQIEQRREGRYLDINRRANRNDRIERKYTSFDRRNRIDKNGAKQFERVENSNRHLENRRDGKNERPNFGDRRSLERNTDRFEHANRNRINIINDRGERFDRSKLQRRVEIRRNFNEELNVSAGRRSVERQIRFELNDRIDRDWINLHERVDHLERTHFDRLNRIDESRSLVRNVWLEKNDRTDRDQHDDTDSDKHVGWTNRRGHKNPVEQTRRIEREIDTVEREKDGNGEIERNDQTNIMLSTNQTDRRASRVDIERININERYIQNDRSNKRFDRTDRLLGSTRETVGFYWSTVQAVLFSAVIVQVFGVNQKSKQ